MSRTKSPWLPLGIVLRSSGPSAGLLQELDLLIVHAKWDVDSPNDSGAVQAVSGDLQRRHETVWGRFVESEIRRRKAWQRLAIFGHTPISTYVSRSVRDSHVPLVGPQIILLDTGAALSMQGRLTAVCVEDRNFVQIDRGGNVHEGILNL